MITVLFLSSFAIVAVLAVMLIIRGRSRQAMGMSGIAEVEKASAAPKPKRANGVD